MGRKETIAARDAKIKNKTGQSEASIENRKESLKEFNRRLAKKQFGYEEKAKLIAAESIKKPKKGE